VPTPPFYVRPPQGRPYAVFGAKAEACSLSD
jgi:hypothetical protein